MSYNIDSIDILNRNPQDVDGAVSMAGDLASRCRDELGKHFRGCSVAVFRDFPGNSLPVVGGGE